MNFQGIVPEAIYLAFDDEQMLVPILVTHGLVLEGPV
jgi:hypothetical protein